MPKTKIVCTIGPASRDKNMLERLLLAGMSVVRLNFAHGNQDEHAETIGTVRALSEKHQCPVAILQDLAGPKIRVGQIAGGPLLLERDSEFVLSTLPDAGSRTSVSITYAGLPKDVRAGDTLLLNDGAIDLEVLETGRTDIRCRVRIGGELSSGKGVNAPSRALAVAAMTEKDKKDLLFGLEQGVDIIALSFVRSPEDLDAAREIIEAHDSSAPLIAKIEHALAVEKIGEIIEAADGVMVARGDLGVEIPLEEVPHIQKEIILRANQAGKPVITATQMLRSMVEHNRPTRAEVTDVANAALDGTDAVMLSEETAVGRYPEETVSTMRRIVKASEAHFPHTAWLSRLEGERSERIEQDLADAACRLAEEARLASIITFTKSGGTARLVARGRPRARVIAGTPEEAVYRRLSLVWGVEPYLMSKVSSVEELIQGVPKLAGRAGVTAGENVLVVAGDPADPERHADMIKIVRI